MLEVSLDWLEYTFFQFNSIDDFLSVINYNRNHFIELECGRYGYRNGLKCVDSQMRIYFNGFKNMGIHISVPGSAIDLLCDHLNFNSFELINYFQYYGYATRLDLALDDVGEKYFTVFEILKFLKSGNYVSRFKEWSFINAFESKDDFKDNLIGNTIYLGRRKSNIFLRIYDKYLETIYKTGYAPVDKITRWELETKGDGAQMIAQMITDQGTSLEKKQNRQDISKGCLHLANTFFTVLGSYFRLIKKDNVRKTRCSVHPKYSKFLDAIVIARLSKSKKILDIDQKMSWLIDQCSTSYAMACAVNPEFGDILQDIGSENFDRNKLNMIDAYNGG